ncbi:MAG: alpha-hydroxy acid oxidase, partial [Porticoccaceae bacterium]
MKRETLNHIPADILAPDDYMRLAPDFIDDPVWAYIEGAAGFEITASRNRAAFNEVRLTTRVLQDFSTASTACSLLGQNFKHPVFLAPVAHQQLVHGDGEKASIAGAGAVDACFVASTLSSFTLEDIAAAGAGPKWFQLYFQLARDSTRDLVQRAQAAGYSALVVTVDVPVTAMRYRQQRAGFNLSVVEANLVAYPRIAPRTLTRNQSPVLDGFMADAPTWQDIAWLRSVTDLPLLIKGITHPLDVRQAIALGVDGVIVSNHGGRSVDGLPATLELLPLTREAAGNRIALLMDGG